MLEPEPEPRVLAESVLRTRPGGAKVEALGFNPGGYAGVVATPVGEMGLPLFAGEMGEVAGVPFGPRIAGLPLAHAPA